MSNSDQPSRDERVTRTVLKSVAVGAAVTVAAPAVVGLGLAVVGFGAGGVAAGSLAALWQSLIGNVAAGSVFAGLQAVGATGLGAGAALGAGGVAAAATAISDSAAHECPSNDAGAGDSDGDEDGDNDGDDPDEKLLPYEPRVRPQRNGPETTCVAENTAPQPACVDVSVDLGGDIASQHEVAQPHDTVLRTTRSPPGDVPVA